MNHLLLLLSALTGLGVVPLTSAQRVFKYDSAADFSPFGKTFKKFYADSHTDKTTFCVGKAYDVGSDNDCLIIKVVATTDLADLDPSPKDYQHLVDNFYPNAGAVTSVKAVSFSSVDAGNSYTVKVFALTFKFQSGVVINSDVSVDYELHTTEKKVVKSGSGSGDINVDVTGCRDKDDNIFTLGELKDLGNCKVQACSLVVKDPASPNIKGPALEERDCDACEGKVCKVRHICTFTGPSIIDFEGGTGKITDHCNYNLLTSGSGTSAFKVNADYTSRRISGVSFLDKVTIVLYSKTYELEQGMIFKTGDGTEKSLTETPQKVEELEASKTDRGLLVNAAGYSASVFFDGYTVQLSVTAKVGSDLAISGLCATASDTSSRKVAQSCDKIKKDPSGVTKDQCNAAKESCAVLKKAPFTDCNAVISPDPYVKVCGDTLCDYPSVDNLPCQFLETYARACDLKNKKVQDWRLTPKCPAPKAVCGGLSCSSMEFCGVAQHSQTWSCLCEPSKVASYRKGGTLGGSAQCDKNTGSVSLVNCLLVEKGIDYTKLHLEDSGCSGVLSDGKVTFTFSGSEKCGTEIVTTDTEVTYKNTIKSLKATGPIVRQDQVTIPFKCTHAQPELSDLKFSVSSSSVVEQVTSGSWDYQLTMKAYLDPGLSTPASTVKLNQKVYVELKATGLDPALVVVVIDSCWANKETDPKSEPKYDLITDRCANSNDKTVAVVGNGKGTSSSFSFTTFQFLGDDSDIHLHCKVKLCGLKTGNECARDCSKSGRRRRSARLMEEDPSPALITMTWTA